MALADRFDVVLDAGPDLRHRAAMARSSNLWISMFGLGIGAFACAAGGAPIAETPCAPREAPPAASARPSDDGRAAASAKPAAPLPSFTIAGTRVLDLASELTQKQHRLIIGLPDSFEKEPNRRYPVLLVLDGQWDFALVNSLAGGLRYDAVMPEMLIVGLSYPGESPDFAALRSHDYVPTRARNRSGAETGGGAANFLTWLETAVLPLLERDYRADAGRRILAGASYGGLFVLHALFEKPDLFWGYVAISPAVGWDERYLFRREKEFRQTRSTLERRLWLSSGSQEQADYLREQRAFFAQVSASRYPGLALAVYDVPGERHAGVKPEAYNRALRFMSEPLVTAPK